MPYTENQRTKIHWEEHGEGDPLLLIMGLSYTLEMWHRSAPVLAKHYRTILFDNRGVGRSDVPPGPYSIPEMASDAIVVLDAAGVARAHVFGLSMGGLIAQELALQYPARVRSLILGGTHHGGPETVLPEPQVLDLVTGRVKISAEEAMQAMIPFVYDEATPRARVAEDLAIRRRTFATNAGYLGQLYGAMVYESRSRLSQLAVPTLVLHGESDRLVPPENGRRLAQRIPGAQLLLIPAAGHIFTTDQPELSHQAILSFLSQVKETS